MINEVKIIWHLHPDGELIVGLRTAYRNSRYLAWIRRQKCWSCPSRNDITASHIFRGYHGLKNHDWAVIPQCGWCHWEMEYHKDKFTIEHRDLPVSEDAEQYFQRYLKENGLEDDRRDDQRKPV